MTIQNYGFMGGFSSLWQHNAPFENYHICDLSHIDSLTLNSIKHYSGELTMNGGTVAMEIYGGETYISGDIHGDINHYGGGFTIGKIMYIIFLFIFFQELKIAPLHFPYMEFTPKLKTPP